MPGYQPDRGELVAVNTPCMDHYVIWRLLAVNWWAGAGQPGTLLISWPELACGFATVLPVAAPMVGSSVHPYHTR